MIKNYLKGFILTREFSSKNYFIIKLTTNFLELYFVLAIKIVLKDLQFPWSNWYESFFLCIIIELFIHGSTCFNMDVMVLIVNLSHIYNLLSRIRVTLTCWADGMLCQI